MTEWALPVGIRLPLPTSLTPADFVAVVDEAVELGFSSVFVGDHVILPTTVDSPYPNTPNAIPPFSPSSPWLDPLVALGWIAGQVDAPIEIGTSVVLLPLRNPVLFAKQVASLSWLTQRGLVLGIGSGWLRDEYDVVGADFEHRATVASESIRVMRDVLESETSSFLVGSADARQTKQFMMRPKPAGPVEILWGGHSRLALKLVARHCDGWIPTKRSFEQLEGDVAALRRECDQEEREFASLRLVVKPGPGPHPSVGGITAGSLDRYAALGFTQALLELPLEPSGVSECVEALRAVAAAC